MSLLTNRVVDVEAFAKQLFDAWDCGCVGWEKVKVTPDAKRFWVLTAFQELAAPGWFFSRFEEGAEWLNQPFVPFSKIHDLPAITA
jgi:hypothetical protein